MSQEGAQTLMRNAIKKIPQSYHEESEVIQLMVYPNFCLESRRPKAWGCDIDIPEGSFHMCSGKHDVQRRKGLKDRNIFVAGFRCMDDIEIEMLNS